LALKQSNTSLSKSLHLAFKKKSGSHCDPDLLDALPREYYITNLSPLAATKKSVDSKTPRTKQHPALAQKELRLCTDA
jgi:hypothetical protein